MKEKQKHKLADLKKMKSKDVLNLNLDFKTMANLDFKDAGDQLILLKKMVIKLYERVIELETK